MGNGLFGRRGIQPRPRRPIRGARVSLGDPASGRSAGHGSAREAYAKSQNASELLRRMRLCETHVNP
ncbi:hypothetical protein HMPREF0043_01650 [Actinobaculum sp. oral taxon 183 str. F0552]|nr:hypothetical protein HMPREF0043_01650 [Actinobaculum sp. oral taxon 183 str. F0552]